jgi:hypothetical protein
MVGLVDPARAVSIPCRGCGAPLPIDLSSARSVCSFCGRPEKLGGDAIWRVRRYLAGIDEALRRASAAATQATRDRRWRGRLDSPRWVLLYLLATAPLLVLGPWWTLGPGADLVAARAASWFDVALSRGSATRAAFLVFALGVAGPVGLLARAIFKGRRRRVAVNLPADAVGPARCSHCGAELPMLLGQGTDRCPFCASELVTVEAARQGLAAAREAEQEHEQARLYERERVESALAAPRQFAGMYKSMAWSAVFVLLVAGSVIAYRALQGQPIFDSPPLAPAASSDHGDRSMRRSLVAPPAPRPDGGKEVIVAFVAAGAAMAWLVAFLSTMAMMKHRAAGITRLYLVTHGAAFFGTSKFRPSAAPHRRRFLMACAAFFGLALLLATVLVVTAR